MNEFLEIFGSIPISKVIVAAIALIFLYKTRNDGYDLIIKIYDLIINSQKKIKI